MLKENSRCAMCEKRSRCVQQFADVILRDKSRAVAAIFDMYETVDCQMGVLPFLMEKIDEQMAQLAGAERDELVRVSGFATRLNALDTLVREANDGNGLTAVKQKIAGDLLLGMVDEYCELGPVVLFWFYFQSTMSFGDFVRDVIARRMTESDRDASTVEYELTLLHIAEVVARREFFDEMHERTYDGGMFRGEWLVEEGREDAFGKPKGKYLN